MQLDYQQIRLHTNNTFVLQARSSHLSLKGQMLPTTVQLPGALAQASQSNVFQYASHMLLLSSYRVVVRICL
jgi:hypothetical protein